jgi:hypothetical protein
MKCFPVIYLEGLKKIKKHFNKNKQTLDRGLNLRSQSAKQASHPLQGDDRWFVKRLSTCVSTFWTTCVPLLSSQAPFPKHCVSWDMKTTVETPVSDILPVSSNGGWSDPRKSFLAGCLTYIRAWTTLCSLAMLVTSIIASEFLNTGYQVSLDS